MAGHILVIEDEPNIIEALSFILSRDGWEVRTHSGGEGVMQVVRTRRPDLIVLDVMLPHRSGFELLEEIRADAELAKTPVLMLTARGQRKDREMAERAGVSRFMTKPFSNTEILEAVRALAGGA